MPAKKNGAPPSKTGENFSGHTRKGLGVLRNQNAPARRNRLRGQKEPAPVKKKRDKGVLARGVNLVHMKGNLSPDEMA